MRIHREGYTIILTAILILVLINAIAIYFFPLWVQVALAIVSAVQLILVIQFFRVPKRNLFAKGKEIICPADGKVVVIEPTLESEVLGDKRIQISIFMSPLNVHVNWFPISGSVTYSAHHKGKYLVAWHPKSSTENERTTVGVAHESGHTVIFRQIAGAVARRIVCYAKVGQKVEAGAEFGFIKFGSRVDVFLPLGSEIKVQLNQKVTGRETLLAILP